MDKSFLKEYVQTTNENEIVAFEFLCKNRRKFSKQLFKEAILNFRTIYRRNSKEKICFSYIKNILNKKNFHSSDLAIGYNILKYVNPSDEYRKTIVEYLEMRLSLKITNIKNLPLKLKEFFILKYIEENILIKRFEL